MGIGSKAAALLALAGCGGVAHATDAAQDAAATGDIVVTGQQQASETATKTDTPLIETPQSITIITPERYFAQGALTVSDTLRYVAGVKAEAYGLDTRSDDAFIRGLSPLTYQDGLRRTFGGFRNGPKADIFLLDRVEVLRGPSSMLYGQTSTGGLLNVASKTASFSGFGGTLFGSYGTFDRKQIGVDLNAPLVGTTLAGRVAAVWRQGGTQTDRVDERRWSVQPSIAWRPGPDTEITLLGLYQDDDNGWTSQFQPYAVILGRGLNGRLSNSVQLGEPGVDKVDYLTRNVTALVRHRFAPWLQLKAGARHEWFRSNQRLSYVDSYSNPADPFVDPADPYLNAFFPELAAKGPGRILNRFSFAERFRSRTFTTDGNLQADFRTGPIVHKLLVGIDYARYRASDAGFDGYSNNGFDDAGNPIPPTATPIDAYDPVYGGVIDLPYGPASVSRETQLGVYLQDQITAFDRLHILGGVRRDRATSSGDGQDRNVDRATTFRGAILFDVRPGLVPYYSYSESFQPLAGADIDNVPYSPTRGRQHEVGIKWQPDRATLVTLAGFDLVDSGRLTNDPTNPLNSIQAGTVKSRGVEIEASRQLPGDIDVIASYSYTRAKDSALDPAVLRTNQFDSIPKHLASAFAVKTIALGNGLAARAGGGARYVSKSFSGGTLVTPGYVLFDGLLGLDYGRWRASLNATNIGDRRYEATCLSRGDCFVGLRRTVNFSLGYRI